MPIRPARQHLLLCTAVVFVCAISLHAGAALAQVRPGSPSTPMQSGTGALPPVAPAPTMPVMEFKVPLNCEALAGDSRALVSPATTWTNVPARLRITVSVQESGLTGSAIFTMPSPWAPGGLVAPVPLPQALPEKPAGPWTPGGGLTYRDPNAASAPASYGCTATYEALPTTFVGNALVSRAQILASLNASKGSRPPHLDVDAAYLQLPAIASYTVLMTPMPSPISTLILVTGSGKPPGTVLGVSASGSRRVAANTCGPTVATNIVMRVENTGGSTYETSTAQADLVMQISGITRQYPIAPLPAQQKKSVVSDTLGLPVQKPMEVTLTLKQPPGSQKLPVTTWTGHFAFDCGSE